MKKKIVKRILAIALIAVMIIELMPTGITSVSASNNNLQIVASKTTLNIYEEQVLTYDSDQDFSQSQKVWSTSDDKVVSVNNEGKIKGLSAGTATITLTIDGGYSDSIDITVQPLTDYRLKKTLGTVTFADGIECLNGKASIAELYTDSTYGTKIQLEEGVFSADVTMTESGGFRIMFGRTDSKTYYSFRVLQNCTTSLIKTESHTLRQFDIKIQNNGYITIVYAMTFSINAASTLASLSICS